MADKIYPFNINPTDILIQNENGGGMLMNDQFVSIVSNMLPDEKKLLDGQNNTDAVNVQTNKFSSGIFITNGNNENPTPVNDLASNNFDSLSPVNDNVILPNQNIVPTPSISILTTPTPQPTPQTTPQPSPSPLTSKEIEEGLYEANFLPAQESSGFQLFDTIYEDDEMLNNEVVKGIENGTTIIKSVNFLNTPSKYNISKVDLANISTYVKFAKKGTVGKSDAYTDWANGIINPNVVIDIATAAKAAGVVAIITTAKTGHKEKAKSGNISRHMNGTGVDVAIIDGIGSGGATNSTNGNSTFRNLGNKLKDALVQIGYTWNKESKNDKAVLWQTNTGGNHYNHLHISNRIKK